MRAVASTTGVLLIVFGTSALITGDVGGLGAWWVAAALGLIGLAGLISALATAANR